MKRVVALSIAGSDSGGGAGVQADLRVFSRLGVFGTTAITAVTAQNLKRVADIAPVPRQNLERQIEAVFDGFSVGGVKTGMLFSADTVEAVAEMASSLRFPTLVVDPVFLATSGAPLLASDAVEAYERSLFPKATIITPNLPEASQLWGKEISTERDMENAAKFLGDRFEKAVLLKGGHLPGDPIDILYCGKQIYRWSHARVTTINSHGTGCMLSAAITALLAKGHSVIEACGEAIRFLFMSLENPIELPGPEYLAGIENVEKV